MLVLQRYVDNLDLLPLYQLPQKMVPYVYVLRIGIGDQMLCDLNGTLVLLKQRNARHTCPRQHEKPNLPQKQNLLRNIRHRYTLCLRG